MTVLYVEYSTQKFMIERNLIKMKKLMKISALALVLVMLVAVFASCAAPAKDPKDAEKALKDAGYKVEVYTEKAMLNYIADGLEAYLSAVNAEDEEFIYVFYFEDKDAANDA